MACCEPFHKQYPDSYRCTCCCHKRYGCGHCQFCKENDVDLDFADAYNRALTQHNLSQKKGSRK